MFKHLVLLIGVSPLPNFVVGQYFLATQTHLKTIWLLYSELKGNQSTTRSMALALQQQFKDFAGDRIDVNLVPVSDVSSDVAIEDSFADLLQKSENEPIHLNYTGGTKTMGVYAYQALKTEAPDRSSFSYLDARSFRLKYEGTRTPDSPDLRAHVSLSFKDLIHLHGFEGGHDSHEAEHPELIEWVTHQLQEQGTGFLDALYNQETGFNRQCFLDSSDNLSTKGLSEEQLVKLEAPESNDVFRIFKSKLEPDFFSLEGALNRSFLDKMNSKARKKFINTKLKYIDGLWLEDYVASQLKAHFDYDILQNWVIKKPEWSKGFELDILLMKGYQLVAISCTRSDKRYLCKSKGFEVIQRSRQVGGNESKAIVVTGLASHIAEELEAELIMDTGSGENILLLGRDDLRPEVLITKIKKFIEGQED